MVAVKNSNMQCHNAGYDNTLDPETSVIQTLANPNNRNDSSIRVFCQMCMF